MSNFPKKISGNADDAVESGGGSDGDGAGAGGGGADGGGDDDDDDDDDDTAFDSAVVGALLDEKNHAGSVYPGSLL
ncbi:hypothetical protein SprV_0802491700 [Sparganum proliferum]